MNAFNESVLNQTIDNQRIAIELKTYAVLRDAYANTIDKMLSKSDKLTKIAYGLQTQGGLSRDSLIAEISEKIKNQTLDQKMKVLQHFDAFFVTTVSDLYQEYEKLHNVQKSINIQASKTFHEIQDNRKSDRLTAKRLNDERANTQKEFRSQTTKKREAERGVIEVPDDDDAEDRREASDLADKDLSNHIRASHNQSWMSEEEKEERNLSLDETNQINGSTIKEICRFSNQLIADDRDSIANSITVMKAALLSYKREYTIKREYAVAANKTNSNYPIPKVYLMSMGFMFMSSTGGIRKRIGTPEYTAITTKLTSHIKAQKDKLDTIFRRAFQKKAEEQAKQKAEKLKSKK